MTFLFKLPLSRIRAWTCVLTNLAATPGLGSIMAQRFFAGTGQLLLALTGFFLILGWMFKIFYRVFLEQSGGPVPAASTGWLLKWGVICFGVSWLWALVTCVSLVREAKASERNNAQKIPPRLFDLPGKPPKIL